MSSKGNPIITCFACITNEQLLLQLGADLCHLEQSLFLPDRTIHGRCSNKAVTWYKTYVHRIGLKFFGQIYCRELHLADEQPLGGIGTPWKGNLLFKQDRYPSL
jgi:hypothetical protein